jgi:hypothetical protein
MIGDSARRTNASQVVIRRIGYISLESRIANDLGKRVNPSLIPGTG